MTTIERVTREEILDLRWFVLRPGRPRQTAEFPEDTHADVVHLAARDPDGAVVSCATFLPEPLDGEPAWRLRGMATSPAWQGKGIGGRLLESGVLAVAGRGGRLLWCNGRVSAEGFYLRHGFVARGDVFDVAPIGPHYVFTRAVATAPG